MITIRHQLFFVSVCLWLACPLALATDWTVFPTGQTHCTGDTDYAAKHDGPVRIYGGATSGTVRKENGFLKFDISVVPDGTQVSAIVWNFYVSEANWSYWSVTPLDADPVALAGTPQLVWDDLEAEKNVGYYLLRNEGSLYDPGWKQLMLGGSASADLTALLASGQDWFAFGGVSHDSVPSFGMEIHGHTGANIPYLVVLDTPPPGNDDCAGAVIISGAPGASSFSGDNTFATNHYDCSASCVDGLTHGGQDMTYVVTLPAGCEACVTLNQSAMDWNGGVYMVADCSDVNGTCVAGASGWLAGSEDETFCYTAPASDTYYIIVDGRTGGGAGPFQLDINVSCLAGPTDLVCIEMPFGVDMTWTNNAIYDQIEVYVDGILDHTLPGTATSATVTPDNGYHCINVCGVTGVDSSCSDECCLIFGYEQAHLLWDFEADDGGFMVEGTGAWEWGEPTYGPCSGPASGKLWATALHQEYQPNACWLLDSPPIELGDFGAFISVDHCYDTEVWYDGGVLWFTTDDFWYNTSEPVKGADGEIKGFTPLCHWVEGQKGFTGSSGGWVTDHWDLTGDQWKGQTVKLRFAFGSDGSVNAPGWMIDNITRYHNFTQPLDCAYTVTPTAGTVPFQVLHSITLYNNFTGGATWTRRLAARLAVTTGSGTTYDPWRAGFTNIAPASTYVVQFPVNIPAAPAVIGSNTFVLSAQDVTPSPYNQPPYPPAGSTCTWTRVVTAAIP